MADVHEVTRDIASAGLKSAPPVVVGLIASVAQLTLPDWVAIVTIVYVVLQSAHLLWKWFREWRGPETPTPLSFEDDEE